MKGVSRLLLDIFMKILIFGAGTFGKRYYNNIKKNNTVVAFVDNNPEIIGASIDGIRILHPNEIRNCKFDKIIIAAITKYAIEIFNQLRDMDIPEGIIEHPIYSDAFGYDENTDARVNWLRDFSNHIHKKNILGSVAECGVNRGHFARYINKYFSDRTLYLFDTFDGFPIQDMKSEPLLDNSFDEGAIIALFHEYFKGVDIEYVMQHMPHPEKCIIKKGIFPETAVGITDLFCFVNLDMDLYQPTLAALRFFWNKMIYGGIILLHDYYDPRWLGITQAVTDFEEIYKKRVCKTPIGDYSSIALIKDYEAHPCTNT